VKDRNSFRVAVLIVGFRNPEDIYTCVTALSRATAEPSFDIFVCENGGRESFCALTEALAGPQGPCSTFPGDSPLVSPSKRLVDIKCFALSGRSSRVWIALADHNLGYAGAINAWTDQLLDIPGWEGIWILNPDTKPEPSALEALVRHSVTANKGMVGSTIVPIDDRDHIHCRAGHHWRKLMSRLQTIGFRDSVNAAFDLDVVEADLDVISGASMYVTRTCLEQLGPMDERFFLYYEDVDWSMRARHQGLGYASDSVVPHKGGTTIGSSGYRAKRSRLSVYLESRNRIHFVRMHFPLFLPLASILSFLYAVEFLIARSPRNFTAALAGLAAAWKGETGPPPI
jgi:N-acetylglucosaminyl-diphospho-decaprenol L-rhamnosyltransferase